jgi:hypothetical protein
VGVTLDAVFFFGVLHEGNFFDVVPDASRKLVIGFCLGVTLDVFP